MPINGTITRKLSYLKEQLSTLRSWDIGSLKHFSNNQMLRRAVERQLQVCVEAVIDICERVLAAKKISPTGTSAGNLREIAESGIIENADIYIDMIRFRNFIVHRYEAVEPEIVYNIVKNKLDILDRFINEITAATEL